MMFPKSLGIVLCLLGMFVGQAQDSLQVKEPKVIDPLSPAKAAFYSAVLPGLGQIHNKKYWKLPLLYGGLGAAIYSFDFNNKRHKRYRNAYKSRMAGFSNDEFFDIITEDDRLLDGQDFHKRNRDLAMVFIVGIYLLNILDANVDAHLNQYNVNDQLTFKPVMENNYYEKGTTVGLALKYNF
jgi:hypothetical protein